MHRRAPVALAVLGAAVLAACGTTVRETPSLAGAPAAPDEGLAAASTAPAGVPASSSAGGSVAPPLPAEVPVAGGAPVTRPQPTAPTSSTSSVAVRATPDARATSTDGKPAPVTSSATAATIPTTGHGWDAKYAYLGVLTQKDAESVFASAGYGGIDPGDTTAQATAVADDINAHGGLFGRQLKLVFHDESTLSTATDPATAGATTCADLEQDHPVFAVVSIVSILDFDSFRTCIVKAGSSLISASLEGVDDGTAAALHPGYFTTAAASWTNVAPVLVSSLKAQGWFGGWNARTGAPSTSAPKIGVLTDSTPNGQRIAGEIERALTSAGYTDIVPYAYAKATDGQTSSVLQFEGKGVTHVISDDYQLSAFQIAASTQGYKPRYGITTFNSPYGNLEAVAPHAQNVGALGLGWAPAYDVSDANDPGVTGPGQASCLAIMGKAGQAMTGKRLARAFALQICDGMRLLVAGTQAGGGLTPSAVTAGLAKSGASLTPAGTFISGLSGTRFSLPGAFRTLAWSTSCTCYRYVGAVTRF